MLYNIVLRSLRWLLYIMMAIHVLYIIVFLLTGNWESMMDSVFVLTFMFYAISEDRKNGT